MMTDAVPFLPSGAEARMLSQARSALEAGRALSLTEISVSIMALSRLGKARSMAGRIRPTAPSPVQAALLTGLLLNVSPDRAAAAPVPVMNEKGHIIFSRS